ncbi:MAG: hypothetical protein ACKO6G_07080 [Vulcanococcus sp.]
MSHGLPGHGLRPLLALVLALGLAACGRPRPSPPPPAAPAASPTTAATGGPTEPQARRQLQAALASADDQFNRGENDLACGQVQRAQGLMQQRADRATPAQREQLLRFQRACSIL